MVSENKVLKIFRLQVQEVTRGCTKLRYEKLHILPPFVNGGRMNVARCGT